MTARATSHNPRARYVTLTLECDAPAPHTETLVRHAVQHYRRQRGAGKCQGDGHAVSPQRDAVVDGCRKRAEVGDAVEMARYLRHRLGGHDRLAVHPALLEEHIEDVAGRTGQQLQRDDEGARRCRAHLAA